MDTTTTLSGPVADVDNERGVSAGMEVEQEVASFQNSPSTLKRRSRDDLSLYMEMECKPRCNETEEPPSALSAPTSPLPFLTKKHSRGQLTEALSPATPPYKRPSNSVHFVPFAPCAPFKEIKNGSPLEPDMLNEEVCQTDILAAKNMVLALDTEVKACPEKFGQGTPLVDTPGAAGSKLLARVSLQDRLIAEPKCSSAQETGDPVLAEGAGLSLGLNLTNMIESSLKSITAEAVVTAVNWPLGQSSAVEVVEARKDLRVSFGTVTVYTHERILSGCGVPHADDYPLGLGDVIANSGWEYPLDTYEEVVRIKVYGRRPLKHHPGKGNVQLKPLTVRQRRMKFREGGVDMLSTMAKECNEEVRVIQESRDVPVYCTCPGVCNDYCECNANGIGCYVEEFVDQKTGARLVNGCGCMGGGTCGNQNGREKFDGAATQAKILARVEELEILRCSEEPDS